MAHNRDQRVFEQRLADWRYGTVVYQVMVDRFAPSDRLEAKLDHYAAPRRLLSWQEEIPQRAGFAKEERLTRAELVFYGGDLQSLASRLDYIQSAGAEVLYLNPIFDAFTNHKYDANDFFRIDPQYGTEADLRTLVDELHRRGMKLMLDGVFNHMGRRAPIFQKAATNGGGTEREFFTFGSDLPNGYLGWRNVANLPELRLESPDVHAMILGENGVVPYYLREVGIDGWRLDVAPDLGHEYLRQITETAHRTAPHSAVIGECWNYPEEWLQVVDGILNMHLRSILLETVTRRLQPRMAGHLIERMIDDSGIEGILRSHLVLDNHDLPRLATVLPSWAERRLARIVQFALPGSPVIYYGSELGMPGGTDPLNRAPMRWDMADNGNEDLQLVRRLVELRRENPALQVGDFRLLDCENFLAFLRWTGRARESIVAIINPNTQEKRDFVPLRDSRMMDSGPLECLLSGERTAVHCGMLDVAVPAQDIRLFRTTDQGGKRGYSMLKRVP